MSNKKSICIIQFSDRAFCKKKITETLFKKGIDLNYFDTSIYKKNIKNMTALIIAIALIVIVVVWYISTNNRLVALANNRENAFADIDVQLKQRYDLIPQLVAAVKGYMDHEAEVLTRVTQARSRAISATDINSKIAAEKELSSAMGAFNIQVEAYPDLKANTNFMHLQQEIADIENKLASVRRYFNSTTKELNTAIQSIPTNIVAGFKQMTVQPFFDLGTEQRQQLDKAPEISFK